MDYIKFYERMTTITIIEWFNLIQDSNKLYTDFISNMFNNWRHFQDINNMMFIKEMQKTLKETESIPN